MPRARGCASASQSLRLAAHVAVAMRPPRRSTVVVHRTRARAEPQGRTLMCCVLFARGVRVDIESVSSRESAQRWGEEALWLVMLYTYDANIFAS